jgi:hypothetical protein
MSNLLVKRVLFLLNAADKGKSYKKDVPTVSHVVFFLYPLFRQGNTYVSRQYIGFIFRGEMSKSIQQLSSKP